MAVQRLGRDEMLPPRWPLRLLIAVILLIGAGLVVLLAVDVVA